MRLTQLVIASARKDCTEAYTNLGEQRAPDIINRAETKVINHPCGNLPTCCCRRKRPGCALAPLNSKTGKFATTQKELFELRLGIFIEEFSGQVALSNQKQLEQQCRLRQQSNKSSRACANEDNQFAAQVLPQTIDEWEVH